LGETLLVEATSMKKIVLLFLLASCGRGPAARPLATTTESGFLPPTSDASTVTADTATVQAPLAFPSQLYVEHDATIYARSAGIVESILVDLGTRVAAGQPMARLESTDQRIALAQAQEKFASTRQDLDRQRALKAAGVVTVADSERVEFEHREAVLALRKATRDFDLTAIVAPFAGVVTERTARIHRLVASGDSLFRVTALAPVLAAVRVPEGAAAGLKIGAEAEVTGLGGVTVPAKIIRASPVIDPASGTREVILQLGAGPRLTPGSSVSVRLGAERRTVVTLPRNAVDSLGYALVWSNDRTTLRALTLGSELPGDQIEVVSGLEAGEKVVRTVP
jgi:RND family efflux transporter MFP subunit